MWPSHQRVMFRFVVPAILIIDSTGFEGTSVLARRPVAAQAADGEHLLQALAETVRGAGVGTVEQPSQVLGAAQAQVRGKVRVRVVEGLHQLRVHPRLLSVWQVISDVPSFVEGAALRRCETAEDLVHSR